MAAFHDFSAWSSHAVGDATVKSRAKPQKKVNPILRKLSHSARASLELDRAWDVPNSIYEKTPYDIGPLYDSPRLTRSNKDLNSVTFDDVVSPTSAPSCTLPGSTAVSSTTATRRYHHHSRSISGASHVSVATSNSSNGGGMAGPVRAGSTFVHPFQQIPRGATPPVSYANSLVSYIGDARDYSPSTITEDEVDISSPLIATGESQGRNSFNLKRQSTGSYSNLQPALGPRRPSLVSQRTSSSFTDSNNTPQPSLRINTSRSLSTTPALSSRLAHVSSQADLHVTPGADTPTSAPLSSTYPINSPSSSVGPMSPLRSSFEAGFPRLRAKSDLDTATHAGQVREARRKFEEKERAKEERYAREDIKRRERADNKRALAAEKKAAAAVKEQNALRMRQDTAEMEQVMPRGKSRRRISTNSSGNGGARNSFGLPTRPSLSRKSTSVYTDVANGDVEKFSSNNYDAVNPQNPPAIGDRPSNAHAFIPAPVARTKTAKRKTQGKWHMFILWLRTKLLRASKK